ncbi:MAG TPA: NfeD family protein [Candidatus Baltobacteraceae bacterium]|nr:NfeD family protein [Candidatus Baltobacteraceae bacterium]
MVGMRLLRVTFALAFATVGLAGLARAASPTSPVVIVPITGMVDDGMAHLVQRSIAQADSEHAAAVVLDVNSNGGLVEAAEDIRAAIFAAHEPVIAYVEHRAFSAASLITLSTSHIMMAPGSVIGSAEPHPTDPETISALKSLFVSTAQRNHRPAKLAAAFVDKNIDVPDYKTPGTILTLSAQDAVKTGMADAIEPSLDAALASERLAGDPRQTTAYTWGEELARFANTPEISGLLLTIGMLGLILEMQTMHGIAGTIGVGALALFFGTHVEAGFSNGLVIALAIAGLIGILWELHVVPGHGVPGILGGLALLAAVLLAFGIPFFFIAVETFSTAIIMTAICFALLTRVFPENAWMRRLALVDAQGADYVTSSDFKSLLGKTGVAASYLRPAGVAQIDGKRVDVLTEGEFIAAGTPIRVTRVEGARVFVEPVTLPDYR